MKKVSTIAGIIALSIIPNPSFSGEVEQKEIISVTEQLLPQILEKYKNLNIPERKVYKKALINYLEDVQKKGATGVSESLRVDNAAGAVIQGGDGGRAIDLPTDDVERINNSALIIDSRY